MCDIVSRSRSMKSRKNYWSMSYMCTGLRTTITEFA